MPRLDRKKSAISRIKRMKASGFNPDEAKDGETFPFHEDDLRFRHYKKKEEPCTNAVIFFLMDVSGSMSQDKKFLARSFCFLMYQFIRSKYESVELVFITHDMQAREVEEKEFFTQYTSGGTIVSTALELTQEIIDKRFHPSSWNIYLFQCSDGDNFASDNIKYLEAITRLKTYCQLIGYCEIDPDRSNIAASYEGMSTTLFDLLVPFRDRKLQTAYISRKEDVWKAFKTILGSSE